MAEDLSSKEPKEEKSRSNVGMLRRIWRIVFGRRSEDYEKRLQYLSKEETAVVSRMRRRQQASSRMIRNLLLLSAVAEVVAVIFAITITRTEGLTWQRRASYILPVFVLPILSYMTYSTLASFTRMLDNKGRQMLEKLRAERKAKIDELKERTNYYLTQQLIQKYDLDPAAKAAAAAVLASKMGADSGFRMSLGNESKTDMTLAKSKDVKLAHTDELRHRSHRKQPQLSGKDVNKNNLVTQISNEASDNAAVAAAAAEIEGSSSNVVEHYTGPALNDGGWIGRLAKLLGGDDPRQCPALICGNCHMHNGLVKEEDFSSITYYCPHCRALNRPPQSEAKESKSGNTKASIGNSGKASSTSSNIMDERTKSSF